VHFLELEVPVPGESHEYVGTAKEEDGENAGFHDVVDSSQWLVVSD
jgi:hypothetical protein